MSRRLRPLTADGIAGLGSGCAGCSFWESPNHLEIRCGAECDGELLRSRMSEVNREWGEYGRMALEDEVVLGFIKYAPARYFRQARWLPAGAADPAAPLIACLHVRDEVRCRGLDRVLLHAAMRDMHGRGERWVYAYGRAAGNHVESPMPELGFLLDQGFSVDRPHPEYPLLRLEIRSLAAWTENLEAVLESLLMPLGRVRRAPTPSPE
jgi:GNAT superfamily N-acetyltransferase